MQKIKNENGVTMVALIVTIVVLFIIIGISFNSGLDSVDETIDETLKSEIQMIQQVAISEYIKAKELGYINSNERPVNFVGKIVSVSSLPTNTNIVWQISSNPEQKYKAYYELTPSELESMGVLRVEDTYILNYYTGEVYNKTQEKTSTGELLYIKATGNSHIEKEVDDTSFNDWNN